MVLDSLETQIRTQKKTLFSSLKLCFMPSLLDIFEGHRNKIS